MGNGKGRMNRRHFLKGAAAGAAAAGAAALVTPAAIPVPAEAASPVPLRPTPEEAAEALRLETAPLPAMDLDSLTVDAPGSDFMVDVLKTLGFEYISANPASSAPGIHESFLTYG